MIETAQRRDTAGPRVLLLTELFPPDTGGSAVLFGNVYSRMRADPVTVIRHGDPALALVSGHLRTVGVPMQAPDWGVIRPASLRRYARTTRSVVRECRTAPAIVHCGRALHEGFAAMCAQPFTRTPYLCWAHGEELRYPRASRELMFLLRRVLRGAAALLANSHNTARELMALGVPRERIHVVHPGVDAEAFTPTGAAVEIRRRYARADELLMLTVGRLQTRKGHDLAIDALACGVPGLERVQYVIVGDGEERTRLERLAVERGVAARVHFAGAVPAESLRDYYSAADLFVHPNRQDGNDVEGFGIVFLEAAAAGLPTIGGNSGGVPEAVEAGVTGLLVSGTDAAELAAAIGTFARSDFTRRKFGTAGRNRVQQHFTWERAASQVSAVHRALAGA